jgi:uncharacterized protein with FMN-binding domain
MRRAILAVTATVAGLVALLSLKTHSASSERAVATPQPTAALPQGERAITGNVANTAYGPVQVQLVVKATRIVTVNILEQPASTEHDLKLGQIAFPRLIGETITAQSSRIDTVSGATYTSGGYIRSLQSALDNGV